MNKKILLLGISIFFISNLYAIDEIPTKFKDRALNIVKQYSNAMSSFASNSNIDAHKSILTIFENRNMRVFDDISDNYSELSIYQYLNKIELSNNLSFIYNFNNPTFELYNFGKNPLIQVKIDKIITKNGKRKTVNNIFYIDLIKGKIKNVLDKVPNRTNNLTPIQMWQKALEYYQSGNYVETKKWAEKAADSDVLDAIIFLAVGYFTGIMNETNYSKALYYFKLLDNKNYPDAFLTLGYYYETGLGGVVIDYNKSLYYYKKGSDNGVLECSLSLGQIYYFGEFGEKDYEKAIKYTELAANKNLTVAQAHLGTIHERLKNYSAAIYWYNKAILPKEKADKDVIAFFSKTNLDTETQLMLLGRYFGDPTAMHNLANFYSSGIGVKRDYKKAFELYSKAANLGYSFSMYNLFKAYHLGEGVEKNTKKAAEWLTKGAKLGEERCINTLKQFQ